MLFSFLLKGIVFTTKQNEMENGKIESAFQTSYSGCKIKFMMNVDFRADFERIRKEVVDLISKGILIYHIIKLV